MATPTSLAFHVVDAFTSSAFGGNPAAVIILPHDYPPDEALVEIAAEFNLSETAFLVPRASTTPNALAFRLRWFTPKVEVQLCGHATLASSRVLFASPQAAGIDELHFETLSGTLIGRRIAGEER